MGPRHHGWEPEAPRDPPFSIIESRVSPGLDGFKTIVFSMQNSSRPFSRLASMGLDILEKLQNQLFLQCKSCRGPNRGRPRRGSKYCKHIGFSISTASRPASNIKNTSVFEYPLPRGRPRNLKTYWFSQHAHMHSRTHTLASNLHVRRV